MPTQKRKIIDGAALRRARLRSGMTQRELARRCSELSNGTVKVDNSNINKAERSSEGIGVRKLPTLAKALDTTVDELLAKGEAA
jgi:transcriptional regulator with XRE-family HTH domain